MTKCWFECPSCKKDNPLSWDTLAFAGSFVEPVKCGHCGASVTIYANVSQLTPRALDGGEVLPLHSHVYVDGYCACGHAVERHRQ